MADSRADDCIREQEALASVRSTFEMHWREVAERVRPEQNFFQSQLRTPGDKRNEKIFDATAPLALPKYMAAAVSMVMPATQRWHGLMVNDEEVNKQADVQRYFEAVTDILFRMRYAPQANFQAQSAEVIMDHGAFGTGVLLIDDVPGIGVRYKSFPLAQCFIDEDAHGVVNTIHRKFQWTARQALSMFGPSKLSDKIKSAAEKGSQDKFWFMHCVKPNKELDTRRRDYRGMAFASYYLELDQRSIVDTGGFRVFPFAVPRYETGPGEVYGRSPAMKVLPDIKMLNEMSKTVIRAAHMVVSPPIMLSDDGSLGAMNMRPNAMNYGRISDNGTPLAAAFETKGRIDIGLDMMNQRREIINDAFFVNLFRVLVDNPQITATEALLRAQEKGQLLAPPMGRLQTELCGPIITRELDILGHAMGGRLLPEMPEALKRMGGEIEIQYQSPLNLAQRAGAGVGILHTFEALAPFAKLDPRVMQVFKLVATARELAEINGMPAKLINSEDEMKAIDEQNAQQAQMQQILQAAPIAADAAKNLAQAHSLISSSPNQQAPALLPV